MTGSREGKLTKLVFSPRDSVARECGKETVLFLLATRPDVILVDPSDRVPRSTLNNGT